MNNKKHEDVDLTRFERKSNRLKATTLEEWGMDGTVFTISNIYSKDYPEFDNMEARTVLCVEFEEVDGLALECNQSQFDSLLGLFGRSTSEWIGKTVILNVQNIKLKNGTPVKTILVTKHNTTPTPRRVVVSQRPVRQRNTDEDDPFANE